MQKKEKEDEINSDMKIFMQKHKVLGMWIATPDGSADVFLDEATMYRFISKAHEVEKAYDSIIESKALERASVDSDKKGRKKCKEVNYFG